MQRRDTSSRGRPGFADLFAALPVAVVVVDPDHRVAHANALAEQLLNLSERLMVGQPLAAILPPIEAARTQDGQGLAVYDTEITTPHGGKIRVDFAETQIADHPGWRVITLHSASNSRRLSQLVDRAAGASRGPLACRDRAQTRCARLG